jgi:hypothetical protein
MMALDLRRRFHDFKPIGRAQFEGQSTNQISMKDDLGQSASAYFSPNLALAGWNHRYQLLHGETSHHPVRHVEIAWVGSIW